MTFDQIEELIRRFLSAGIAVVVVFIAPGADGGDRANPGDPAVVTIEPGTPDTGSASGRSDRTGSAGSGTGPTDTGGAGDRSGAAGTDPDQAGDPPSGTDSGNADGSGRAADRNESASEPDPDSAAGTDSSTTAAERHGWGTPNREEEFSGGTDQWDVYDGPGHAGKGQRSASAVSVENGILTITGDSAGTTGGMAWNPGQRYGRWEGRVRAPASDPSYNALLLLWPDAEDFPVGGEIDFMELMDASRQQADIFIHYGSDNSQVNGEVEIDATEWHNWALEWTPDAITAFVDGQEWYRTTDTSIFPPGPMHLCIQLDWFPTGDTPKESTMQVDWVRQYSLDTGDSTSSGSTRSDPESGADAGTDDASTDEPSGDRNGDEEPVREAIRRMFSWR